MPKERKVFYANIHAKQESINKDSGENSKTCVQGCI